MDNNTKRVQAEIGSLAAALAQLHDQRKPRGVRYALQPLLLLLALAKLAGEDRPSGVAQWVQERAALWRELLGLNWPRMPHASTWRRLWQGGLAVAQAEAVASRWLRSLAGTDSELLHLDGKTLRGTIPTGGSTGVHLLAAYQSGRGLPVQQTAVDKKENEISAAPRVLAALSLEGQIVTGDALLAQQELSRQVLAAQGNYFWVIKGTQPTVRQAIADLFSAEAARRGPAQHDFDTVTTLEKSHGRLEIRTLTNSSLLNDYLAWPGLQQVCRIERTRLQLNTGVQTQEVVYAVTSLRRAEADAARLLVIARAHWSIENGLHYVRDVTFHEDRCRLKSAAAAQVLALFNNLIIGLLRRAGWTNLAAARRHFAAHIAEAISLIHGVVP